MLLLLVLFAEELMQDNTMKHLTVMKNQKHLNSKPLGSHRKAQNYKVFMKSFTPL